MMTLTRIAAIFALATLGACASLPVGRDFNKLTAGEQLDYTTCVFKTTGRNVSPGGNSTGAVLDNILSAPGKMQDATRSAANECALRQFINPTTIPGMR